MAELAATASRIDALRIRRTFGREQWSAPIPFGPCGWRFQRVVDGHVHAEILVSQAPQPMPGLEGVDETEWIHASMVRRAPDLPSYDDLCQLKLAVWGAGGEAYQVFASAADHVNIHAGALHLWGRADGRRVLPNFGRHGTI